ncbi:MAG: carboxypeptidase regulatory-like domain-containing protein, partial [Xanthomonadales bacterium]|nr:carboxypeptidase regulatory-like domain-containing protein [Xanthomonadales bacterium]
ADKHAGGATMQPVKASGGGLADVYVYVKEGLGTMEFPTPSAGVTLDQDGCVYRPHVLAIQVGQPLVIKNSDGILHNINTQPTENRGFNISQPVVMETTRDFSEAEVMIPVKCDVHGWMEAYIGVQNHPYAAVSGSDGTFTIENLPPGDYVIEAWHEMYGTQTVSVSVAAQGTGEANFEYSSDMAGNPVPLGEPLVLHAGHGAQR